MLGWYGNGSLGVGMAFMGLLCMLGVAAAFWAVARWSRRSESSGSTPVECPRAILDRRLASGHINAGQYEEALRVLKTASVDDSRR